MTALINARWVNACGKLPRCRPVAASISSAYSGQRAGEREQLLAQSSCSGELADLDQRRDEPERADRERALLAREPVVGLPHAVAQHEPVLGQLVGDREHGGADPRVVRRQEPHQRHHQQRRIERVGVVVLDEHAAFVDAVGADVGVDFLGRGLPARRHPLVVADPGQSRAPIGGHPAHQLRGGEVLRIAPHLPDAAVGFAPPLERSFHLALDDRPQPIGQLVARARVQVDRVEHRAPHVVLVLVVGAVADPHRARVVIARQVLEHLLLEL